MRTVSEKKLNGLRNYLYFGRSISEVAKRYKVSYSTALRRVRMVRATAVGSERRGKRGPESAMWYVP